MKSDIERVINMAAEMDNHCQRLYKKAYDILLSKGMTDEEIFKTNMHLHANSTNALSCGIRMTLSKFKEEE